MKDYTALPQEEKDALVKAAGQLGYETETAYGNCAQSTLYALYKTFPDCGITEDLIKGCFGLAGGCGCGLQGTCGALNGATCAISVFRGRPSSDFGVTGYGVVHEMIREVIDQFTARYGSVLCKDVLTATMGAPYDWKTEEGAKGYEEHNGTHHCSTAVRFCTETIAQMIVDGRLKYE